MGNGKWKMVTSLANVILVYESAKTYLDKSGLAKNKF
jgi:hypothetical protein